MGYCTAILSPWTKHWSIYLALPLHTVNNNNTHHDPTAQIYTSIVILEGIQFLPNFEDHVGIAYER